MDCVEINQGFGQPQVNFAQALAQLARDHGVSSLDVTFRLGFDWDSKDWGHNGVRMTWSEGRHGDEGRIVLRFEGFASVKEIAPNTAKVPVMIYASEGNFYDMATNKGRGQEFYDRWRHRSADFPKSAREAFDRLDEHTKQYMGKRHRHLLETK